MAIEPNEWNAIRSLIESAAQGSEIVYGKVSKSDPRNMLVWVDEFGTTPIPCVGYEYVMIYYDETPTGVKKKHTHKTKPVCPEVGQTVVVLRQFGSRRLPKCVGILLSHGFVE